MFVTTPSNNDVICGGSRSVRCHAGNERFERIVMFHLNEYQQASKKRRSDIISNIVHEIQTGSEHGFLQKDPMSKTYYVVPDHRARERTSQAFRDALHRFYRSSKVSKKNRRLEKIKTIRSCVQPSSNNSCVSELFSNLKNIQPVQSSQTQPQQQQQQALAAAVMIQETDSLLGNYNSNLSPMYRDSDESLGDLALIEDGDEQFVDKRNSMVRTDHLFMSIYQPEEILTHNGEAIDKILEEAIESVDMTFGSAPRFHQVEDDAALSMELEEDKIWQHLSQYLSDIPTASFLCETALED